MGEKLKKVEFIAIPPVMQVFPFTVINRGFTRLSFKEIKLNDVSIV